MPDGETGAFPARTAREYAALLWERTGCDPDDPAARTEPVHRVGDMALPLFAETRTPRCLVPRSTAASATDAGRRVVRCGAGHRRAALLSPRTAGYHLYKAYPKPAAPFA